MKKGFLLFTLTAITLAFAAGVASAANRGTPEQQCKWGFKICALVCNKDGNAQYNLYEFAHYNDLDKHFIERVIKDDSSRDENAQLLDAEAKLARANPDLALDYHQALTQLSLNKGFFLRQRPEVSLPKENECTAVVMASYKKSGKWLVDKGIHEHMSTTDRAGFKSRMALVSMGAQKQIGPQYLVDLGRLNLRLFYSENEEKVFSASHKWPLHSPEELQAGIKRWVNIIFPKPTEQNVAALMKPANTTNNIVIPPPPALTTAASTSAPAMTFNNVNNNPVTPPPGTFVPGSDMSAPANNPAIEQQAANQDPGYEVPKLIDPNTGGPLTAPPPNVNGVNLATNGMPAYPDGTPINTGVNTPVFDPNSNTNTSAPPLVESQPTR